MSLGQSTLSDDERRTEAEKLVKELFDHLEEMSYRERDFISRFFGQFDAGIQPYVSPKQLFWMRDLYGRYCV